MNRLEAWGAELAMALRRRSDAQARIAEAQSAFDDEDARVSEIQKRILAASTDDLYLDTGEFQRVVDSRDTEPMTRYEDLPCPGPKACHWYGTPHMHDRSGQTWAVDFSETR